MLADIEEGPVLIAVTWKPFAVWLREKIEHHRPLFSTEDMRQADAALAALDGDTHGTRLTALLEAARVAEIKLRDGGVYPINGETWRGLRDALLPYKGLASVALSESTAPLPPEANEIARMTRDAARWRALKELAGYWQDGSQQTVKLYQDDALWSCFIEAGGKTYGTDGTSFDSAIDAAIEELKEAPK